MRELELALKKGKKNRKSPGTDILHAGLLKFEGTSVKKTKGHFLSTTCNVYIYIICCVCVGVFASGYIYIYI